MKVMIHTRLAPSRALEHVRTRAHGRLKTVVRSFSADRAKLPASTRAPTSAYVHLPFCRSRCYYCDFAISVIGTRTDASEGMRAYAEAVTRETRATATRMRERHGASGIQPLETIFFGGGTPSLVPVDVLGEILGTLRREFGIASGAEISAEMDPGTFNEDKLRGFLDLGVNRVSLGVQSFDDEVLKRAGRSHDVREAELAIEMLRSCGVPRWSVDLIGGLPGVDAKTWRASLDRVIESGADHVSVYDLQVEKGTAFYLWYGENAKEDGSRPALPSEDASADAFREASAALRAAGYEHYEVSSYAKPGARCKHNQIYWQNGGWYGFGMSATSHVDGERMARPRKMNEYYAYVNALEKGEDVGVISTGGDGSDALFEHLMLRLRTSDGLDLENATERFGASVVDEIHDAIKPFVPDYAVYSVNDRGHRSSLRLTDPEGLMMSTEVLSTLISKMPSLADDR